MTAIGPQLMQPQVLAEIDHGPPMGLHQEARWSLVGQTQPQMIESMGGRPKLSDAGCLATTKDHGGNTPIGTEGVVGMRTNEIEAGSVELSQHSYNSMGLTGYNDTSGSTNCDIHKEETIVIGMNKLGSMKDNNWCGPATCSPGNDWTSAGVRSGSSSDVLSPPACANVDTMPVSLLKSTGGNIVTEPALAPRVMGLAPIPFDQRSVLDDERIAIVGSGFCVPGGASSPSELWQLLNEKQDLHPVLPDSRFSIDSFYDPNGLYLGHAKNRHTYLQEDSHRSDVNNTNHRQIPPTQRYQLPCEFNYLTGCNIVFTGDEMQGWMDRVEDHLGREAFDASFFGMKSAEAKAMDPQQRLLLEVTLEALESAFGDRPFNSCDNVGKMITINDSRMLRADKSSAYGKSNNSPRLLSSNMVIKHFDGTQSTGPEATALGFLASSSFAERAKMSSIVDAADISRNILMWMMEYNLVSCSVT